MEIARLRNKGWSEAEIMHLLKVMNRIETTKHPSLRRLEHACMWIVVFTLGFGTFAVMLALLPLFATSNIAIPIVFSVGACFGLLLVHVLHDLRLERTHQHYGVGVLVISSILITIVMLHLLDGRIGSLQHTTAAGIFFGIGILIPYLVHWRIVHDAA